MSEGLRFRRAVEQAGFARLSHLIVTDTELSDGAVRLYARLLYYARQDVRCWPGRQRLADDLGVSKATIKRRIAELVDRGLITRERRGMHKTAITWIEDLATVYSGEPVDNSRQVKNDPSRQVKNDPSIDGSKMTHKEETEEETKADDDGWTDIQRQSLTILTEAGADVTQTVRAVARRRTPDDVQGMIDAARCKPGLTNPLGWAIARLRDGEVPPRIEESGNGKDPIAATCPVCYRVMPIGLICEDCGRCLECCEC